MTNLTQCIQAKTSESDDATSLAQFFPSFLWIVRDFTLKLVDENGQKISSSQYLENCLKAQQGCSDSIVSKNRIRELICSFFRERDCLTMVRPADDEEVTIIVHDIIIALLKKPVLKSSLVFLILSQITATDRAPSRVPEAGSNFSLKSPARHTPQTNDGKSFNWRDDGYFDPLLFKCFELGWCSWE